jgi:hypothetical protein
MPTSVINAVKCFVLRTTYLKIIDVKRKVGIPFLECIVRLYEVVFSSILLDKPPRREPNACAYPPTNQGAK